MNSQNQRKMLGQAQRLYDIGSREAILEFLQKNDPNGVYSDQASFDEGYDPMTYDEALLELEGIINELLLDQQEVLA